MKKLSDWFDSKCGWFFTNGRKTTQQLNSFPEDGMDAVAVVLERAKEQGLETEVVTWALKYMKNHPDLTISEAIRLSYLDWIK